MVNAGLVPRLSEACEKSAGSVVDSPRRLA
jgi:hypothetical protein